MTCQAGPGIEPGPSALKASALPIELTWQTKMTIMILIYQLLSAEIVQAVDFGPNRLREV